MAESSWELSNFVGIHTQPAKSEVGHASARDMKNMRIDGNGWLQLRPPITDLPQSGKNITGLATSKDHVWVLRENGNLYVREKDSLTTEKEIIGIENLSGKLSVVDFSTYVILTSEGDDTGYIIDLRENKDYEFYELGIVQPPQTSISIAKYNMSTDGELSTIDRKYISDFDIVLENPVVFNFPDKLLPGDITTLTANRYYIYRYRFVSAPDDKEAPWQGMTSEASTVYRGVHRFLDASEASTTDFDLKRTLPAGIIGTKFATEVIYINKINIAYTRVEPITHIEIFRSEALEEPVDFSDQGLLNTFTYRRVGRIDISDVKVDEFQSLSFYDGVSEELWQEQAPLEIDTANDRLPSAANSLFKYNDIIFAPLGDRLIYSDVRFGNIIPWAFPRVNEIRVDSGIDFCAEINEVLLFGGRNGLWRLTGTTEYNFAIGQISSQGPINAHSWGKSTDALGFVGESGFYITDASQVVAVSDPFLDIYFQDRKFIDGAVTVFKDNDILFAVTLQETDKRKHYYQFKKEDTYWTRWELQFIQSAEIVSGNATLTLITDGTGILKRLDWNDSKNENSIDWLWESHPIDLNNNERKRFSELLFTGNATDEITLETYKDEDTMPVTKKFKARSESLRPVRVPIHRIGRRLRFRVSGNGKCLIQGLAIKILL